MNKTSRLVVLAFALFLIAGMTIAAAEKKASLDGKSFEVQLMKSYATSGDSDTLSFADGMFDSSACHQHGFGRSAYTAKNTGSAVTFEVHAVAKDQQTKELWKGTVEGNSIHGTMKLTDPKGTVTHYEFQGEMKTS